MIFRTNQDHGKEQLFEHIKHRSMLYLIQIVYDVGLIIILPQDNMSYEKKIYEMEWKIWEELPN